MRSTSRSFTRGRAQPRAVDVRAVRRTEVGDFHAVAAAPDQTWFRETDSSVLERRAEPGVRPARCPGTKWVSAASAAPDVTDQARTRIGRVTRSPCRGAPTPSPASPRWVGGGLRPENTSWPQRTYRSTVPLTQVTVPPPTHTWPSASRETCTRPRRPMAVPWLATYGAVTRAAASSHCPSEAFRLPRDRVLERAELRARTRAPRAPRRAVRARNRPTPMSMSTAPGRTASTASALASRTADPAGAVVGRRDVDESTARCSATTSPARPPAPPPGRRAPAAAAANARPAAVRGP